MLADACHKSIPSRLDGAVPRGFISIDFFEVVAVEARTVVSMGKKKISGIRKVRRDHRLFRAHSYKPY